MLQAKTREQLYKIADAMYFAAQYLTTDASRLHKAMNDYLQFIIQNFHKEEPVSDDLEEVASRYAEEEYNSKSPATLPDRCRGCYAPLMYAFKAGAKWQKKQDQSIIELAEDHAMLAGMEKMREEMMEKAVELCCEWLENHNDYQMVLDNCKGVRFDMTQCIIDLRKAMQEK